MLRALPSCSHFMTTAKPMHRESAWRGSHRRDVILRLRWSSSQYLDGWVLKQIFLVNRWRYEKLSICGNGYFILTLLGVCHETVASFCPLKCIKIYVRNWHLCKMYNNDSLSLWIATLHVFVELLFIRIWRVDIWCRTGRTEWLNLLVSERNIYKSEVRWLQQRDYWKIW